MDNPVNKFVYDQYLTSTDYYLHCGSKGLLKVKYNDHFRTLRNLMQQAGVDIRFIQLMPLNIRFKDIEALLVIYDRWLLCEKE